MCNTQDDRVTIIFNLKIEIMKTSIFIVLLTFAFLQVKAQDYVDIIKLSSNNTTMGNDQNDYKTGIYNQNLQLYYPIRASESLVVLTGFTVENTSLNLFQGADRGNLLMTRLNLGIKHQHSEKWSGTYLFLPKIASDFKKIGGQDFQFGGLGLLGYQVSETWQIKFGVYVSSENHGSTITPLIGVWHRSKNEKFYINATLPIRMDMNYAITKAFSMGLGLLTSVKSYNLSGNGGGLYVQEESIRASLYASYGFLDNSLILRVRGGFDTSEYGLYNSDDRIGGQILTFPVSGDNRDRLNPDFNAAFYFGGDLIYRFDLRKEKKKKK